MGSKKDHYSVLGVSQDSSQQHIRKTFRKRAKECHPDCAGPDGAERFRELNTAHEVLSDPEQRRCYDRSLENEEGRHCWASAPSMEWARRPGELIRDAYASADQLLDLELVLSPFEQITGVRVPLHLRIPRRCPSCEGINSRDRLGCLYCGGLGHVAEQARFEMIIPPGLPSGRVIHAHVNPPIVASTVVLRMTVTIDGDI